MGFKEKNINFKEDTIKFVEPLEAKFKAAVGSAINSIEAVNDLASNDNGTQDFSLNKDLIDIAIEKEIGVLSTKSNDARIEARAHKREYKGFKKQEKKLGKELKVAREENNKLHEAFNEKYDTYQKLNEKFKTTDWKDNYEAKEDARYKLNEAKKESKEAYKNVQESNQKVDRIGENKQNAKSNKEDSKNNKKESKKEEKSSDKQIAVLKTILSAKDGINQGTDQSPDDLIASGQNGLTGGVLRAINPIEHIKTKIMQMVAGLISSVISMIVSVLAPLLIMIMIIVALIFGLYGAASSIISFVSGSATSQYTSLLTDEQINDLILERGWKWEYDYDEEGNRIDSSARKVSTLPQEQQDLLYFAFSKVGYPYSQDERTSGSYYDCSSLAYYTEAVIGKDITCYTAATQAKRLYNAGKSLSLDSSLQIGDLIFYGGKDNDRYLGIYHVAIYVGNGYCVEAFNKEKGVIYSAAREKNAVMICRP